MSQQHNLTYTTNFSVTLALIFVWYTGYHLTVTLLCISSREGTLLLKCQKYRLQLLVLGICFPDKQFPKNGKEHSGEVLQGNIREEVTWWPFLRQGEGQPWRWEKGASPKVWRTHYLYEIVPSTHKYSKKSLYNSEPGIRVQNSKRLTTTEEQDNQPAIHKPQRISGGNSHTKDYQPQGCVSEDLMHHPNLQIQTKMPIDLEMPVSPLEPGFRHSFNVPSNPQRRKFGCIEAGIFYLWICPLPFSSSQFS